MKIRRLAMIAALALPPVAIAQNAPDKTTEPSKTPATGKAMDKAAKLSAGDVKIVSHIHHVNMMEINVGKAAQRSSNAAIKSFGDALVNDHRSADKDLTTFARAHKLATIPADKPETDAERQDYKEMSAAMARLTALKGAELDREVLNMAISDHDKELTRIDAAIGAAANPDLQSMLKDYKAVLQRHADQARDLQKNLPVAAGRPGEQQPSSR